MARKLRLEYAGACYHVINRGNYRRELFKGKGAAEAFVACLDEAAERFGWVVHAYVVMSNHFHLALETPEPNLSDGMKWLQGTWARRFNGFRGEVGRPFQGRYKALHVEPGHALAQVAHYIHLNPVRAGLVKAEELLTYPWSSLVRFCGKQRPAFLECRTILGQSGELRDSSTGWKSYLAYLGALAEKDARLREKQFGRLSRGWMIGSDGFCAALKKDLAASAAGLAKFSIAGGDRAIHRELREEVWEEKLNALAKAFKISLTALPQRYSAPEKVGLAVAMKKTTSVSNGWLAERLGMGQPASVSQFVGRFLQAGKDRDRRFLAALSKVKK